MSRTTVRWLLALAVAPISGGLLVPSFAPAQAVKPPAKPAAKPAGKADEPDPSATAALLNKLGDPSGLTVAQRRALSVEAAESLAALAPKQADNAKVMEEAFKLLNFGVTPAQTEVEYFGENPGAQASLNTAAAADRKVFQQVADGVGRQAATLANQLGKKGVNQNQVLAKLQELKPLKFNAEYSANMVAYAVCISLRRDDPQRVKLADETVKYLGQFDNAGSTVQPLIRTQIGKLELAKGDFAKAREALGSVADVAGGKLSPAANLNQQHEARYFAVVTDLEAGDRGKAKQGIEDLGTWEATNYLPTLKAGERSQVEAAMAMLKFRLAGADADAAGDPAAKTKANDDAIAILADLIQKQPDLQDLVFDQMAARVPANAPLAGLNPLILQGMEQPGFAEYTRWEKGGEKGKPDAAVIDKALRAAAELVKRRGQPGATEASAARAAYFLGYGMMSLGRDKPAAAAFMDYAENFKADPASAKDALDHAEAIVGKLRKAAQPDDETRQLFDRFLPLAIGAPYNEKRFNYDYGLSLQEQHKYADAAKAFAAIPSDDKRYPAARFLLAFTLSNLLSDPGQTLSPDERKADAEQLQQVAADVAAAAEKAAASAAGDEKKRDLFQLATVLYRAAVSARRDLKDPAKALGGLDGFERRVAGVANEKAFDQSATTLRVNCLMDQGKVDEATKTLVPLLGSDPAAAEDQLFDLLAQVGRDLDAAKANNDLDGQRRLAANQGQLSGFLVTFAQQSKNPAISSKVDNYRLFDATSKRQAAELAADPAAKQANLKAALAQYQSLTKVAGNPTLTDSVTLGIGLTQYDLGNHKDAVKSLSDLVKNNKVGQPFTTDKAGLPVENPQYWETTFKLIDSIDHIAKQSPNDPAARTQLNEAIGFIKRLYVTYGAKTGGAGYKADFDKLRVELAPDLKLK